MYFDLIRRRKIWYAISLLIIIPGIFSLLLQGLNLGIDFRGGTIMELKFDKEIKVEEVRSVLAEFGWEKGAEVQRAGDKEVFIKMNPLSEKERNEFKKSLENNLGTTEIVREDKVGPKIGKELTIKALLALVISSILMVIYISWRFELKSGLATIIALLHDVLIALSVFSILQIEINSSFVAAVLTIVGYSINNTIVVFDRIRENTEEIKYNDTLEDIVNRSIWQSMSRSINTALTVLFVLVALFFFGGATIKYFVLAIIIGLTAGTYSSMLIASPLWVDLKKREKVTA